MRCVECLNRAVCEDGLCKCLQSGKQWEDPSLNIRPQLPLSYKLQFLEVKPSQYGLLHCVGVLYVVPA